MKEETFCKVDPIAIQDIQFIDLLLFNICMPDITIEMIHTMFKPPFFRPPPPDRETGRSCHMY